MGYQTSIYTYAAIDKGVETADDGPLRGFVLALPISILLWAGIVTIALLSFNR